MSIYQDEEYDKAKDKLLNDYATEYAKCETYIHSMRTNTQIEGSCMQQILDDFLSAQADERALSMVTGPDLRSFCDKILKAESERIRNKNIHYIQWLFAIPLIISIDILIRSFLYTRPGRFLDNINNLFIEGYELFYFIVFIAGLLVKKLISVLFFHYSRLLRTVETVIFIFIIVVTSFIAVWLSILFPISIPISFTFYIIMTLVTVAVFITSWLYYKRNNAVKVGMISRG